ncbi:KTSC domain-containing protein [Thalassobaculum litoreum]|uniref:KTSC domain-containing protein n=1 Tax=Thalassobaculum litoreum DSM 18839 TaxID=1123362 RepID=A0A8G2EYI9_9PROT|nr:KTSC domain-containing protein [Thalassobaculum litoreum]SDG57741.1 KTSC domain-containing protein [Thalassobaculum litoreum DSM 18839]
MTWMAVDSSTIARMDYDEPRRVLKIEFKNGTRYEYYDVPTNIFQQMKAAPSKGHFLAVSIKGRYRYARV